MNKRITSLTLVFVMVLSLLATAVPVFAEPAAPNGAEFSLTASETSVSPGDIITITVCLQQKGSTSCLQCDVLLPDGLEYVTGSGAVTEGLAAELGFADLSWTDDVMNPDTGKVTLRLTGYGAEFSNTEIIEVVKFQCKVLETTPAGTYTVDFERNPGLFLVGGGESEEWDYKPLTAVPVDITVTAAPKPATDITLNRSELTLTVDDTETLVATVTPPDTTDTVAWSSDKPGVATVDSTGKVTAVAPGEAIITAKAGEETATCTVKVSCAHNLKTVAEKDSNCTDKGWDEYQECTICGALFETSGDPIEKIPYRPLNNDHDFNMGEWGYKGADGHAHVCTRNPDHHDAVVPHTSSGPATEDTAETCTVCGYVITPATGHVCASHLTKVEAEAATCTEPGNLEHYKCSCGKLYADGTASVELSEEEVVIDALGHDWAEEWSSDETNHWHACTRCDATTDLHAHNPDHEGGATVDYPILCADCGYVMEEQLVEGTIRVELPFRLTVQQLDEMAPGAQTFRFLVFGFGAPVDYEIITDTVDTDGAKTYQGTFTFTIPEGQWGNLSEGFSFLQVVGDAEGWTYDPVVYYAMPEFRGNDGGVSAWTFYEVTPDGWPDYDSPVEEMVFVNGYAAKKPVEPTPSPKPSEPPKPSEAPNPTQTLKPVQPPQTGDHSHLILWVSLLLVSGAVGTAMVSQKRRKNVK